MKKLFLLMLLPLAMSVVSCEKDDDSSENGGGITPNNPKEVSVTSSADVQSYYSVILKGYANGANGKVGFYYSATETDPNPETCRYVETSSIKSDNSYELTVDGLAPNTKYYYRAFATKDMMKVLAKEVKTFTTQERIVNANGHDYVDLGLPSRLLWATCNVGATQPEEYGDYFAWGETEPYYTAGHSQDSPCSKWKSGKSGYDWANYKYCNGSISTMTKYCTSSIFGTVDNKTVLEAADDAATANWGGSWRMPTRAERDELSEKCFWYGTTKNGVHGFIVVGLNGNSIFLPAAGFRCDNKLSDVGSGYYYWLSSAASPSYNAYHLFFVSGDRNSDRCYGFSVRPVCQ